MSQHEQEHVAPVVAQRIEAIVSSAERAANEFRRQVETASKQQADQLREAAETEARRIRQEAASQAAAYLTDSRRIVDEFAAERIARISALTDKLIEQTEQVQRRFAHAEAVRRQIYDLIAALGDAAEAIAREAQTPDPHLPRAPEASLGPAPPPPGPVDGLGHEPPDEPSGETSSAASHEGNP